MWCGIGEYRKQGCNTTKQLTEKTAEISGGGGTVPSRWLEAVSHCGGGQESRADRPVVSGFFES